MREQLVWVVSNPPIMSEKLPELAKECRHHFSRGRQILVAWLRRRLYLLIMSYVTVEVEIDHGRLVAAEPGKLPEKGKGLLTVLEPATPTASGKLTPLEALEALQRHLKLDEKKAAAWMAAVRDARR